MNYYIGQWQRKSRRNIVLGEYKYLRRGIQHFEISPNPYPAMQGIMLCLWHKAADSHVGLAASSE